MFEVSSEADVIDGSSDIMLPVTTMDRVMLKQAEHIGR